MNPANLPRMPFGKHKSKTLDQVPVPYLHWYLGSDQKDSKFAGTVREYLASVGKMPGDESQVSDEIVDDTPPWDGDEVVDATPKDPKRGLDSKEYPRQKFKIGDRAVKINGITVMLDEIRAIRPVHKAVQRFDCLLTHVVQLRPGTLGDSPKALTQLWVTSAEADALEAKFFKEKA